MRACVGVAALVASLGCQGDGSQPVVDEREPCDRSEEGSWRCKDNAYQVCGGMMGDVPKYWTTQETCVLPDECRIDDAGGHAALLPYCYAPGSTCSLARFSTCDRIGIPSPALWTCRVRPSDGTLQWTVTPCSERSPPAICLPDGVWWEQPTPEHACYEVAVPCPLEPGFPYPAATCEGNVRVRCRPVVVEGKAVFTVDAEDCTLEQRVCRSSGAQAGCVLP
ncbi:MAG: hypothetical protein WB493_06900 [Anaeromyxobacteraceae bacterium]